MADEAILRIVLQDQDGSTTGGAGIGVPSAPVSGVGNPPPPAGATPPPPASSHTPPQPQPTNKGVFDPYAEAIRRRQAEHRSAQVNAAYEQMFGSKMDSILRMADSLRGTIGGILGTFAGIVIDTASAYWKHQKQKAILSGTGIPQAAVSAAGQAGAGVNASGAAADAGAAVGLGGAVPALTGLAAAAPYVVIFTVAIIAATKAIQALVDFIDRHVDRYAQLNPVIAQAQAQAEIRQTLGDIKRAQEISADMAKYIKAQSDLQQKYEDLKVNFMSKMLPIAVTTFKTLEMLVPVADLLVEQLTPLQLIAEGVNEIIDLLNVFGDDKELPKDPTEILFMGPAGGGVQIPEL